MASDKNQRKGPPMHWLRGHAQSIFNDPIFFPANAALAFGPVCKLRFYNRSIAVTADADCVEEIFLTHTKNFKKGKSYQRLQLLGGYGLITSEGEHWKRQRRLAQPAFHKEKLNSFLQTFIDASRALAKKWENYPPGKLVPISPEMSELTLGIIGKTLFGIDLYQQSATVPVDVKTLLRFLNKRNYAFPKLPMKWPLPSHQNFRARKKRLDDIVYEIIDARIARQTNGNDLLQMFLDAKDIETGEKMSRQDLRDEVLTMFMAGFETSSVALTWIWYLLSEHADVRQKFIQELQTNLQDEPVRPDHLVQLTYTRQIIEETLRLYPSVFSIPREAAHDISLKGVPLKKGTLVLTSLVGLHRNPKYWKNPEKFDPDRFSEENRKDVVKNAYIPFGTGQRICIGQQFAMLEMVAALAVLGRKFHCEAKKGYIPKTIAAITTNVTEGMPMHIHQNI